MAPKHSDPWKLVIPAPRRCTVDLEAEGFSLPEVVTLFSDAEGGSEVIQAALPRIDRICQGTVYRWKRAADAAPAAVRLTPGDVEEGHYELAVTSAGVTVRAGGTAGFSAGLATVVQAVLLLDHGQTVLPAVTILDHPAYPWRGFMVDVARHFLPMESLHRVLDVVWLLRLNRFHLHLTDDQGWRLPVSAYPLLTDVGGWRSDCTSEGGRYGGFYSAGELRELDSDAAALGIIVVPEIDLPGHASAAITAYPQIGCSREVPGVETRWGIFPAVISPVSQAARDFIRTVFAAATEVFQGPYIHVGGDEVMTESWASLTSEAGQEDQLYQQIVRFMTETVLELGRVPLVWDEASRLDLPRDTIILNWREPEFAGAALERGYRIVLCPQARRTYLDHKHRDTPLEAGRLSVCTVHDSSRYEPLLYVREALGPDLPGADRVLGGQGNLWTEGVRFHSEVEYMGYLRLAAISEGLWTGTPGAAAWSEGFRERLEWWRGRMIASGVNVYPGAMEA